jgi:hypothetical protein
MVTEMKVLEGEEEGQEEIRRQTRVKEKDQLRNL